MKRAFVALEFLIVVLLVGGLALGGYYVWQSSRGGSASSVFATMTPNALDGDYSMEGTDPYAVSLVTVSSSTPDSISYEIGTIRLGHVGTLSGIAYRVQGTSTLAYVSRDFHPGEYQKGCKVTIFFPKVGTAVYTTTNVPIPQNGYTEDCSSYHGAHGMFFDGEDHVRSDRPNPNLPTLVSVGFSEADRNMFLSLNPPGNDIVGVETVIGQEVEGRPTGAKLSSSDIPGNFGYRIETANMYDASSACDFKYLSGGFCEYGAFLKDGKGGYWMMGGSNGDPFIYVTNRSEWSHKLPAAFESELTRLGLAQSDVTFGR